MRVTFLLPDYVRVPVGGIKVLYELANGLSRRGHQVTVLHFDTLTDASRPVRLRHNLRFRAFQRGGGWFRLDPAIATALIDPTRPERLPAADVVIAGSWQVVPFVHQGSASAGERWYFVQHYMGMLDADPVEVDAAWRLPVRRLVIAEWLAEKVRAVCGPDADVTRIPIAIDHDVYGVSTDPADRRAASVVMLVHDAHYKGTLPGLAALEQVRIAHPELRATLFAAERPELRLPDWATFIRQPRDLRALYNSAAIFVHPSTAEGWPLPPAEAMTSGCAVAAFANPGVSEYAVDGRNALLVGVGDIEGLAGAIRRLIEDDDLRVRLARQGAADMAAYTWERSVAAVEAALEGR